MMFETDKFSHFYCTGICSNFYFSSPISFSLC